MNRLLSRPNILRRKTAAFAFGVIYLVTPGGNNCSPNPNYTFEPIPTPAISAEQARETAALLIDALLDLSDLPPGTEIEDYEKANVSAGDDRDFIQMNGWAAKGSDWSQYNGSVFALGVKDDRFAFADATTATAFMDKYPHANWLRRDWPPVPDVEPGTYAFAQLLAGADSNREIQLRTVTGRVLVSLTIYLPPNRADWREYSFQLLELARQRTREALTAVGE